MRPFPLPEFPVTLEVAPSNYQHEFQVRPDSPFAHGPLFWHLYKNKQTLKSNLDGDPESWTSDQVKMWLDTIEMGMYKARFGRINGKVLLRMTEERLDRLMGGDYADVIVLYEAIADIKPLSQSFRSKL